jgi:hypothetical protein
LGKDLGIVTVAVISPRTKVAYLISSNAGGSNSWQSDLGFERLNERLSRRLRRMAQGSGVP